MTKAGRAVMLVAAISMVLPSPLYSRENSRAPAGSALNCTTFWRVLSLYGLADPESIAEANRMLDALLPRGQEESVDSEDKFTHSAAVTFYRLHSAQLPRPLRERARWDIVNRVRAIERTYYRPWCPRPGRDCAT